jgi:hypothetical protein
VLDGATAVVWPSVTVMTAMPYPGKWSETMFETGSAVATGPVATLVVASICWRLIADGVRPESETTTSAGRPTPAAGADGSTVRLTTMIEIFPSARVALITGMSALGDDAWTWVLPGGNDSLRSLNSQYGRYGAPVWSLSSPNWGESMTSYSWSISTCSGASAANVAPHQAAPYCVHGRLCVSLPQSALMFISSIQMGVVGNALRSRLVVVTMSSMPPSG